MKIGIAEAARYTAGMCFTSDYSEEVAVQHYIEIHPEAVKVDVRAELEAGLKRH